MGRHKKQKKNPPRLKPVDAGDDLIKGSSTSSGSPPGNRVHWLLWQLLGSGFTAKYQIVYRYLYHNYIIYRKSQRRFWYDFDMFIVVRTSEKCFKVTYVDFLTVTFTLKSFDSPTRCAEWIKKQGKQADKLREDKELIKQMDSDPDICYSIYRYSNWRKRKKKISKKSKIKE